MSTGYLVGVFEVIEIATLDILRQAHDHCDRLIVGVVPDSEVRQVRGADPIANQDERRELLSEVRWVDAAVVHDQRPPADHYFAAESEFAQFAGPTGELLIPRVYSTSSYSLYRPDTP